MEMRNVIITLNAALIGFTLAATGARVWRGVFLMRKYNLQDGLITLACFSAVAFSLCQMNAVKFGLGQRMVYVNMAFWPTLIKILMASNTFYFLCNWAVKHALLLFYEDLATSLVHRRLIIFMHCIAFGFGTSSILVDMLQCRPIRKNWDRKVDGWCANKNAFYYANAGIMLATDCVLYAMPFVFTRGLRLRPKQRWGLKCLFGLGGLVIGASTARVVYTHLFATRPDYPYRFAGVMIWAVIENHLAVIVACAPSVKVAVLLMISRLSSTLPMVADLTPPNPRILSSARHEVDVADTLEIGQGIGVSTMYGLKANAECHTRESPLPSPLTPVFSGWWRPSSMRDGHANHSWVYVGGEGAPKLKNHKVYT